MNTKIKLNIFNLSFAELWRISGPIGILSGLISKLLKTSIPRMIWEHSIEFLPFDETIISESNWTYFTEVAVKVKLKPIICLKATTGSSNGLCLVCLSEDGMILGNIIKAGGLGVSRQGLVLFSFLKNSDRIITTANEISGLKPSPVFDPYFLHNANAKDILDMHISRLQSDKGNLIVINPENAKEYSEKIININFDFNIKRKVWEMV